MSKINRRYTRDELFRICFCTDGFDKKVDYNDKTGESLLILNGKSGITDKKCSEGQKKRVKRIIQAALTDDTVIFKRIKDIAQKSDNNTYYNSWKITQDDILTYTLSYLNIIGVKIGCPYRHPRDVYLFKKYISNTICNHIISAIYHVSENGTIGDDDDISPYFSKAIENINNELSANSLDELIYAHATDTEIEEVKSRYSNYKYSYRLSTANIFPTLFIPYNGCYCTDLKLVMNRFDVEEISFDPCEDIDNKAFTLYIPKFFIFRSDYNISNYDAESEEYKLYTLNAGNSFRIDNNIISWICQYYCFILDHIEDFSNRILSIDYSRLCSKSITTVDELREAMNEFHLNLDELWSFMERNKISPTRRVEFITELLKQSVSIFCQKLTTFCDNAIIIPEFTNSNPLVFPPKETKSSFSDISPVKGAYFDEYYDSVHNSEIDIEDDELLPTSEKTITTEPTFSNKPLQTGKAILQYIVDLCKAYPERATELGNIYNLLSRHNIKPLLFKSENELKRFLGVNKCREYAGKIKNIISSDIFNNMFSIRNDNTASPLVKKFIHYSFPNNTSQMYKAALIHSIDEENAHNNEKHNNSTIFKYNMYEDLKCALMKLYELLNNIR